ncbi:MAG: teichoic acid transport system permease protein [Ilumatobacter sp.]
MDAVWSVASLPVILPTTALSATPHDDGLRDARETARLVPYLKEAWDRRRYAWFVATSELRSRQMNSVLGNLWHLLNPILQIAVYYLIFDVVLDISRGLDNFIAYLAIGVFTYGFTQRSTMAGSRSIFKNRGLIKIVWFPRALLPAASTLTETLAALPTFAVMMFAVAATGESITWTWMLLVPAFAIQTVFNMGLALIVARATNHIADVQQILPFIFRLGFYASGVLFNVTAYVEQPQYRAMFYVNPLYCFIEINRSFLLDHKLDPVVVLSALAWTVGVSVIGLLWFRAGEDSYGRD